MGGLRAFFFGSAILFACAALGVGGSYFALQPTTLRMAIPAGDVIDLRIFGTAAELLRSHRTSLRLEFVSKESAAEAAAALERREVQLAVLRSDLAGQGSAQTVLIMRTEAGVIVAPKGGKIQKVTDLAKGTIGVVREGPSDGALLLHVLDYYGVPRTNIKAVPLKLDEVAAALRDRRVDTVVAVGPVSSKGMADIVSEAAKGAKQGLVFLDVEEGSAIAKRFPALESIEVDQGAFGGRPPRPAESFTTLGYTVRLVAHDKVDGEAIAEFVKQLINSRQLINVAAPGAGLMQTPDLDDTSSFIIHSGTRTFVNGEQKTFFDRYSDWIYLGLFVGSFAGSIATGMLSWLGAQRRRNTMGHVVQLEQALENLREAGSMQDVDAVERKADEVFHIALAKAVDGDLDASAIATFEMAMSDARSRIAAQRERLMAPSSARAKAS